jgi:hypothetical protein
VAKVFVIVAMNSMPVPGVDQAEEMQLLKKSIVCVVHPQNFAVHPKTSGVGLNLNGIFFSSCL